jgi:hypothetical protein
MHRFIAQGYDWLEQVKLALLIGGLRSSLTFLGRQQMQRMLLQESYLRIRHQCMHAMALVPCADLDNFLFNVHFLRY